MSIELNPVEGENMWQSQNSMIKAQQNDLSELQIMLQEVIDMIDIIAHKETRGDNVRHEKTRGNDIRHKETREDDIRHKKTRGDEELLWFNWVK